MLESSKLFELFFYASPCAEMHWERCGDDLKLLHANSIALGLTKGRLRVGDLLCEKIPAHRDFNIDLGISLIDWYLSVLDEQIVKVNKFNFIEKTDDFDLTGHWLNTCIPSGEYLAMRFENISESEGERQDLRKLADTDDLTQIPNRRAFNSELQYRCQSADPFVLVLLDINAFKSVNDTYGHVFGDVLLRIIAERIVSAVRHTDFVGRLGGDEFVAILDGEECLDEIGKRLDNVIRSPVRIGDLVYLPSAAIGLVAFQQGDTPDMLYRFADESQYQVKNNLRKLAQGELSGSVQHWHVCDRLHSYLVLSKDLFREFATPKTLQLHYQPIVNLETEEITSFEALIRWRRHDKIISPAAILNLVHRYQLDADFCIWTIEQAAQQWQRWGKPKQTISVNISPATLEANPDLIINALCSLKGLAAEITEDKMLESPAILEAIARLNKSGIQCYWDDFGTRYAVLGSLGNVQFSAIKLDRSVILKPDLMRGITCLIRNLGLNLRVIAEGIETEEQRDYCKLVAGYGQGFLFGHPVHGDTIRFD